MEAGELGWVHTVRSTTLDPAPAPREYIQVSGGIFRDCLAAGYPALLALEDDRPAGYGVMSIAADEAQELGGDRWYRVEPVTA